MRRGEEAERRPGSLYTRSLKYSRVPSRDPTYHSLSGRPSAQGPQRAVLCCKFDDVCTEVHDASYHDQQQGS